MFYDNVCVDSRVDTEVSVTYNPNTQESQWSMKPEYNATVIYDLMAELVNMGERELLVISSSCDKVRYNIGSLARDVCIFGYDGGSTTLSTVANTSCTFVINGTYTFHGVNVERSSRPGAAAGYVSFESVSLNFNTATISFLP